MRDLKSPKRSFFFPMQWSIWDNASKADEYFKKVTGKNQFQFAKDGLDGFIKATSSKRPDSSNPVTKYFKTVKGRKAIQNVSQDTGNSMASSRKRAAKSVTRRAKKRKSAKPKKVADVTRDAAVVGKVRGGIKRKTVKVSGLLRKQVTKILTQKDRVGHMQTISYDLFNRRNVDEPQATGIGNTNQSGVLFSHFFANYYASRLFNKKDPFNRTELYAKGIQMLVGDDADKRSFDPREFKLNILSNNVTINMRNNTNRCKIINLYFCTPKANVNEPLPLDCWSTSISTRNSAKEYENSIGVGSNTPVAVTRAKLYQDPRMHKDFNMLYKTEVKKIRFEPGESTQLTQAMFTGVLDFRKFYRNDVFQVISPCNTYLFWSMYDDLVTSLVTGNQHTTYRAADVFPAQNDEGISVEYVHNCKIGIPEQAGFTYGGIPSSGQQQTFTERQDKFVFDHYADIANTSAKTMANRVDALDPTMDQTSG